MTTLESTDPRAQLAALEEAVRQGDTKITAATIAEAQDAVVLADLHAEAARRQIEVDEAGRLEAARNRVRTEHIAPVGTLLDRLRIQYTAAVNALHDLSAGIDTYDAARSEAIRLARPLGIGAEAEAHPLVKTAEFMKYAVDEGQGQPRVGGPAGYPSTVIRHPLHTDDAVDEWNRRFAAHHVAQQAVVEEIQRASREAREREQQPTDVDEAV